jgi:hypothetical protein
MMIPDREAHYAAVGRLALNWSAFEAIVTSAIWQIGEMDDDIGACVTSQIPSFEGKMQALVSILDVRGGFKKVIENVNAFHKNVRPLGTFRNRLIHDPLYFDPDTGVAQRLQITSHKSLVLGHQAASTDDIESKAVEIADIISRFQAIIKPAIDRFPARPLPGNS